MRVDLERPCSIEQSPLPKPLSQDLARSMLRKVAPMFRTPWIFFVLLAACGGAEQTYDLPQNPSITEEVHHCGLIRLELPRDQTPLYISESPCDNEGGRWRFHAGADRIEILNEPDFLEWGGDDLGLWLTAIDVSAMEADGPSFVAYRYVSSKVFVGAIRVDLASD